MTKAHTDNLNLIPHLINQSFVLFGTGSPGLSHRNCCFLSSAGIDRNNQKRFYLILSFLFSSFLSSCIYLLHSSLYLHNFPLSSPLCSPFPPFSSSCAYFRVLSSIIFPCESERVKADSHSLGRLSCDRSIASTKASSTAIAI